VCFRFGVPEGFVENVIVSLQSQLVKAFVKEFGKGLPCIVQQWKLGTLFQGCLQPSESGAVEGKVRIRTLLYVPQAELASGERAEGTFEIFWMLSELEEIRPKTAHSAPGFTSLESKRKGASVTGPGARGEEGQAGTTVVLSESTDAAALTSRQPPPGLPKLDAIDRGALKEGGRERSRIQAKRPEGSAELVPEEGAAVEGGVEVGVSDGQEVVERTAEGGLPSAAVDSMGSNQKGARRSAAGPERETEVLFVATSTQAKGEGSSGVTPGLVEHVKQWMAVFQDRGVMPLAQRFSPYFQPEYEKLRPVETGAGEGRDTTAGRNWASSESHRQMGLQAFCWEEDKDVYAEIRNRESRG
jgi:hypothetical protein